MADLQVLLWLSFGAVRHRARRRDDPAQCAGHADVHGADAECRESSPLVTFSLQTATLSGTVLVFLIFVVAAAESRSPFRSCCSCRGHDAPRRRGYDSLKG